MTSMMDIPTLTKLRDTAPNQRLRKQYEMMLDKLIAKQERNNKQPASKEAKATEESGAAAPGKQERTDIPNTTEATKKESIQPQKLETDSTLEEDRSKETETRSYKNGTIEEKTTAKEQETDKNVQTPASSEAIFQAIGCILGKVSLVAASSSAVERRNCVGAEKKRLVINMGGKQFDLRFIPGRTLQAYKALQIDVDNNGEGEFILRVYPQALHFPDKDAPYKLSFVPLQFERFGSEERKLTDPIGKFKLCGYWQFIPVCRTPVISVFRNSTKDLREAIKAVDNPIIAQKMTKAQHLPLIWKDSPAKPFWFNPKVETQEDRYFVQVKAAFDPKGRRFLFKELLAEPTLEAPKYRKPIKPGDK